MADVASASERPDAALIAALEAANIHPLWDRYKRITPLHPNADDQPFHWRWSEIEPFTLRVLKEVAIEDIERRALIMCNAAFGGQTVTTSNLIAAFSVLQPGDRAVPHRHVAGAIRFATNAEGASSIVNGRRCEMHAGDLILTPPMCWHGHINESDGPISWFDAANIPLINTLDVNFFEPGERGDNSFWQVDEGDERLWQASGLVAPDFEHDSPISPKYRYPGAQTRELLDAVPAGPDGARWVRYVNPLTGGSVMPTLDCYAARIAGATRPKRATNNAVCLVVDGEGRSTVGDHEIQWSKHDVFTIPHWMWASHQASAGNADLFVVTDRSVHERLDTLREELQ